jgi:hypothetical protein
MHLIAAAEEQTRNLPAPPVLFGVLAFGLLMVLMVGLLMFGKGRPHS